MALIDNFRWRDGDLSAETTFLVPCSDEEGDDSPVSANPACGDGVCAEGEHCGAARATVASAQTYVETAPAA